MSKLIWFLSTWLQRALLPFSFLLACIFDPVAMLGNLRELPDVIRWMWDDCQ